MARLASLTDDRSVSSEQKAELSRYPSVIRLSQKNRALTIKIYIAGYPPISTAKGMHFFEKKEKIDSQFSVTGATPTSSTNKSHTTPVTYHLAGRAAVGRLICTHADGLTGQAKLTTQRIQATEAQAAQESRRRRRRTQYRLEYKESDASSGDLLSGKCTKIQPFDCKHLHSSERTGRTASNLAF